MKQGLLIVFLICAMCAMAHRIPRAVEVEERQESLKICAENTPCAWTVYRRNYPEIIEQNLTNIYCICGKDTLCLYYENDTAQNSHVYRCQKEKS